MKLLIQTLLLSTCVGSLAVFSSMSFADASADFSALTQEVAQETCAKASKEKRTLIHPEVLGPTYEIAEEDLMQAFFNRVEAMKKDGSYDKRFNESKTRIQNQLENPPPLMGITEASEIRTWLIEPTIGESLPEQLLAQAQNIRIPNLTRSLLFINGDVEDQVQLAKTFMGLYPNARIVLTSGSIAEVSGQLKHRIFFDQGAALSRTFGYQATPALIFNGPKGPMGAEFAPQDFEQIKPLIQEEALKAPIKAQKAPHRLSSN